MPAELRTRLKSARRVVVLTGAGISAESGLPTFLGNDGLWKEYKTEGLAFTDGFLEKPAVVWEWYEYRRSLYANARPNLGHLALVELEKFYPDFTLITQNSDGLHSAAGSENILELHGNIHRNHCQACGKVYPERSSPAAKFLRVAAVGECCDRTSSGLGRGFPLPFSMPPCKQLSKQGYFFPWEHLPWSSRPLRFL